MPDISDLLALSPPRPRPPAAPRSARSIVATVAAMIVTGVLFALGVGHRTGRIALLGRAGAFAERHVRPPRLGRPAGGGRSPAPC